VKSGIARVRKNAGLYRVLGFTLNDGTPLKSVEVHIDNGPGSAQRSIPPTPNIRGSFSPISGKARPPANTRWYRASLTSAEKRTTVDSRPEQEKDVS